MRGRLTTENYAAAMSNPASPAAAASLSSFETKSLPFGFCLHQTSAAERCVRGAQTKSFELRASEVANELRRLYLPPRLQEFFEPQPRSCKSRLADTGVPPQTFQCAAHLNRGRPPDHRRAPAQQLTGSATCLTAYANVKNGAGVPKRRHNFPR